MSPDEKRRYVSEALFHHDSEELIERLREIAAHLVEDASLDERDVAVAVAATVVDPPERLLDVPATNADIRTDLPVELSDEQVAAGRKVAVEYYRRRAAGQYSPSGDD